VKNALGLTYFRAAGRLALEVTSGTQWKGMPHPHILVNNIHTKDFYPTLLTTPALIHFYQN
jgi:hypothetical protein